MIKFNTTEESKFQIINCLSALIKEISECKEIIHAEFQPQTNKKEKSYNLEIIIKK